MGDPGDPGCYRAANRNVSGNRRQKIGESRVNERKIGAIAAAAVQTNATEYVDVAIKAAKTPAVE